MLRALLCSTAVVVLCVGTVVAQDTKDKKDKNKGKHARATITKVDARKGEITVRMKNKQGKEETRTFQLAEDIRYLDSTGKVVAIDVFRSGDEVLVVEQEGRLKEVKKADKKSGTGSGTGEKKRGSSNSGSNEKKPGGSR